MSIVQKLKHEGKMLAWAALYFLLWLGALVLFMTLTLREYHIEYVRLSAAILGALVLAKVVIVMEHVPLGRLLARQPAWVDVIVRTIIYSAGVFVAIVIEKGIEGRGEHGGFLPAIQATFGRMSLCRTLANTIAFSGAILGYNVIFVMRRHLGKGSLRKVFTSPLPEEE
jgi:hypothetical protein